MKYLLISALLFVATDSIAQVNYNVAAIPSALRSRANAVIRNEETVVNMVAPDNVVETVKKTITVINENGDERAHIYAFYNKNITIKSIKGEIYNAFGIAIGKFSLGDFIDQSAANDFSLFEDSRVKHYLPIVNQYPYTISYTSEIKYKQNLVIPDWRPNSERDVAIEKSSYQFICKPDDKLRIQAQNYSGQPEEKLNEKLKQKTLTWSISNVPAIKLESYMPLWKDLETRVKVASENFVYFDKKGSYRDWQELGLWNYNDLLKDRRKLPEETVAIVKNLISGITDDKEKARKLYAYMQNKTRYISIQVGIGGYQPFLASDVDKTSYGDCKALVNYMQSLLDVADIESYYCVVEAGGAKQSLDKDFASMDQGNHIILCLPLKGDTTWLECTSQKIPFGYLGDFTDDRNVLACTPTGGKILHTPKLTPEMNKQLRKGEFNIAPDGTVTGAMTTAFKGSQYESHEEAVYKSLTEQEKLLKRYYNVDNIDFSKITYDQNKSIDPELKEVVALSIKSYAAKNGNKLFFKPNIFDVQSLIPESRNRTAPVYIDRGYTNEDDLIFSIPENNVSDFSPMEKSIKNEFGSYESKITLTGNKLRYYRKFSLNDGTFPAENYDAFFKFILAVNSADEVKLVLNVSSGK